MKLKLTGSLLWLLGIGSIAAYAQPKQYNLSLQEALNYAYQNQVDVKNAQIDVEISRNKVKETVAIGLPQVNGTASLQRFLDIPTQLVPAQFFNPNAGPNDFAPVKFGTNYNLSYGVEASQLLFDGNYLLGLQAASVYKELTVKALERTKIETSVSVSKAYYSVLVYRKRLELLNANVDRLKKTLDDTRAYYKNGFAEKIDEDRLSVLYNNLTTELANVTRMVDLSLSLLKFQIGMPVDAELNLTDNMESLQLQEAALQVEAVNLDNRVEYGLIKTQLRLNELDYKRNVVTRAPSLLAFASFSRNAQNNEFSKLNSTVYPTSVVGLQLNVPLIGSGKKWYQTKQAKLAVEKSKNDLAGLENAIRLESSSKQIAYNNSVASLENQKKNMELAREVVRVTKAKYDQGVGSSLEVTTAETSLKEAETNYIGSLYDAVIAKIELDKAYGRIK
jgi:outer membrane protein